MATGIVHELNLSLSVIKTASIFFINLLLNARDAIEENWGDQEIGQVDKRIILKTKLDRSFVVCTVCDTGNGVDRGPLQIKFLIPFLQQRRSAWGLFFK